MYFIHSSQGKRAQIIILLQFFFITMIHQIDDCNASLGIPVCHCKIFHLHPHPYSLCSSNICHQMGKNFLVKRLQNLLFYLEQMQCPSPLLCKGFFQECLSITDTCATITIGIRYRIYCNRR